MTAIQPDTLREYWRHDRPTLQLPREDDPTQLQTVGDPVASGIAVVTILTVQSERGFDRGVNGISSWCAHLYD